MKHKGITKCLFKNCSLVIDLLLIALSNCDLALLFTLTLLAQQALFLLFLHSFVTFSPWYPFKAFILFWWTVEKNRSEGQADPLPMPGRKEHWKEYQDTNPPLLQEVGLCSAVGRAQMQTQERFPACHSKVHEVCECLHACVGRLCNGWTRWHTICLNSVRRIHNECQGDNRRSVTALRVTVKTSRENINTIAHKTSKQGKYQVSRRFGKTRIKCERAKSEAGKLTISMLQVALIVTISFNFPA